MMRSILSAAAVAGAAALSVTLAGPANASPPKPPTVASISTPNAASSSAADPKWYFLWKAAISAAYLKSHRDKWVSGTFVPRKITQGEIACYNGGDGTTAGLQIYNVETRKVIAKGEKMPCNGKVQTVSTDNYRLGEGLRFIVQAKHTISVKAFTS